MDHRVPEYDVLLGCEVPEEAPRRDAGRACNLIDSGLVEALLVEYHKGNLGDLLTYRVPGALPQPHH